MSGLNFALYKTEYCFFCMLCFDLSFIAKFKNQNSIHTIIFVDFYSMATDQNIELATLGSLPVVLIGPVENSVFQK